MTLDNFWIFLLTFIVASIMTIDGDIVPANPAKLSFAVSPLPV